MKGRDYIEGHVECGRECIKVPMWMGHWGTIKG